MEQTAVDSFGFSHFLMGTDGVGRVVLVVLLVLSIASWYLIFTRSIANTLAHQSANSFVDQFWATDSIAQVNALINSSAPHNIYATLVKKSIIALQDKDISNLSSEGAFAEYITRALENEVDKEVANSEYGLTLLASAGSAAPYVGLFGTVWGIYHALVQIGMSGQGTLDKVAGPVGEALIMTALGLAVAIPAVLAYNALNKRNRDWIARLESFSHELYVLMVIKSKGKVDINPSSLRK